MGINTALRIYELLAVNNEQFSMSDERKAIEEWEAAIDLYEQRKFKDALALFKSLMDADPGDKVAEFYKGRCMEYIAYPPPETWDAVNNLTEK